MLSHARVQPREAEMATDQNVIDDIVSIVLSPRPGPENAALLEFSVRLDNGTFDRMRMTDDAAVVASCLAQTGSRARSVLRALRTKPGACGAAMATARLVQALCIRAKTSAFSRM